MKIVNPFATVPSNGLLGNDSVGKKDKAIRSSAMSRIRSLLASDNCVIIDTETTGIPRGGEQPYITELSAIDLEGRTLFSSLLNIPVPVPQIITQITGIDDSMLKGKPSFDAVYEDISEILRGRTVLGWNVAFDIQMLQIECDRLGYRTPIEGCTDVMALYGIATAGKKWCKLAKAAEELGIESEQEHRSLGDCLMTLQVMKDFAADTATESEKLRYEKNLRIIEDAELPF